MESLQGNYKSVARAYAIHNRLLNMKAKLKFYKDSDTSTINRKLLHELEECKMLMKGIEKDSAEREKKLVEAQDFAKKYRVLYLVERTEASAARRQLKKVEARVGEATSALAESMRYESMWRKR